MNKQKKKQVTSLCGNGIIDFIDNLLYILYIIKYSIKIPPQKKTSKISLTI